MTVSVNNREITTSSTTLGQLRKELGLPDTAIAIAVNNTMIKREDWDTFSIKENDRILAIRAACGG